MLIAVQIIRNRLRAPLLLLVPFLGACRDGPSGVEPVTGVTVEPTTLSLFGIGSTATVLATVHTARGVATDAVVEWTSTDATIADVTGNGMSATVLARALGTARIRATAGGHSAETVVAIMLPPRLTVTLSGTGSGVVLSAPAGITCLRAGGTTTGPCNAEFAPNTQVTLTAAPETGHTFGGWTGNCSGTGACVVTMDGARAVGASFTAPPNPCQPQPFTLGAAVQGTISGQSCRAFAGFGGMDIYTFAVSAQTTYSLRVSSAAFAPLFFGMLNENGAILRTTSGQAPGQITAHYVVAPGTWILGAGSLPATGGGAYTLTSTLAPALTCETIEASPGITLTASLGAGCGTYTPAGLTGAFLFRLVQFILPANRTVTARLTSTAFEPLLEIRSLATGALLVSTLGTDPGSTVTASYTAPALQSVQFVITTRIPQTTGAYTFTIEPSSQ